MKRTSFGLLLVLAAILFACSEDTFKDEQKPALPPSDLVYAETVNAFTSAAFSSGQPSVNTYGADPTFTIDGGTIDGSEISEELLGEFSIVDSTGIINVEVDHLLPSALYRLNIGVSTTHGTTNFSGGYAVEVVPAP